MPDGAEHPVVPKVVGHTPLRPHKQLGQLVSLIRKLRQRISSVVHESNTQVRKKLGALPIGLSGETLWPCHAPQWLVLGPVAVAAGVGCPLLKAAARAPLLARRTAWARRNSCCELSWSHSQLSPRGHGCRILAHSQSPSNPREPPFAPVLLDGESTGTGLGVGTSSSAVARLSSSSCAGANCTCFRVHCGPRWQLPWSA